MNPQILLVERSCLETRPSCHMARACLGVLEKVVTRGVESPSPPPQSRLSLTAASRHAPVAPDCLIGTFQVRGPDKPGHSTQTVIHLFGSRRCSCPRFSLRAPRGISGRVIWRRGKGKKKSMTNDSAFFFFFFFMKHSKKKKRHSYVWSSYWPTSRSIIQSRLWSKKKKKERKNTIVIEWVVKTPGASHYKKELFSTLIPPRSLNWDKHC